jgi:hypothetical protein
MIYSQKNNVSITAEFVALMQAGFDKKNLYFVSSRTQRIYKLLSKVISKKKLQKIFQWRLALTQIINDEISREDPAQIIDLGAGYSLRGLNMCLNNNNLIYIDSDLDALVLRKREIF